MVTAKTENAVRGMIREDVMLSRRDEEILKVVHFYRYMTVIDVAYRLFSISSKRYVRGILSDLSGNKDERPNEYLYRFGFPKAAPGKFERIFTLGERGYRFLRDEGRIAENIGFRRRSIDNLNFSYLIHSLALTRFLLLPIGGANSRIHISLLIPVSVTEYQANQTASFQTDGSCLSAKMACGGL